MPTMQKLQEVTGYTRDGLNKIFQSVDLDLPLVERGLARQFTRDNFVELMFLTSVLRIVKDYGEAERVAKMWKTMERDNTLDPFWVINPRTGFFDTKGELRYGGFSDPEMSVLSLQTYVSDSEADAGYRGDDNARRAGTYAGASSVIVFDLADMVRRVDELFEKVAEEGA
ncbi:hypothetical protein [Mesorhizobium sp. M4B.F.Ca.ET.013.02.1.1]|uniref:hypothetical protein n=1 Tax=Mesorhizobium sp. M4B.F.Ca.ET.013.02.1.1 TaxID=2496755 RepID=UPI000FD1D467|nr:hypothetical protein [Mesorhizobium sp. M4B.F.Ca.ET.013.02.1.1]RUW26949.1 hypothetical protein EOA34_06605 [Mesorhizobium sp. M4B.F.Ca.ET.013.02.1.1]